MIILSDYREKMPWDFSIYSEVSDQVVSNLDTGDYTIKGYEDIICIERKKSTSEIALNLGSKFANFKLELERMASFQSKHIICEFPESYIFQFPRNSGIPRRRWKMVRMSPSFIYARLTGVCGDNNVSLHFTNNRNDAQTLAMEIFNDFIRER